MNSFIKNSKHCQLNIEIVPLVLARLGFLELSRRHEYQLFVQFFLAFSTHSKSEQNISCVDSAAAKDMAGTSKKKVPDFIQKATRRKDKVFYNLLAASLLYNFNYL